MLTKIQRLIKTQKKLLNNQNLMQLPKTIQIQYCRNNKKIGELAYKAYEKTKHNPDKALHAAKYFVISLEHGFFKAYEAVNEPQLDNHLAETLLDVKPLNTAEETFKLGICYFLGIAPYKKNEKIAFKLFSSLAFQPLPMAMNFLGFAYKTGRGVAQDIAIAFKCYRFAAKRGLAIAQTTLGAMFEEGEGVPEDEKEALKWYRLGAAQGCIIACNNLGYIYQHGIGLIRDRKEAVKCYRLAALQGCRDGQFNLAWMYDHGKGVKKDKIKALKWYRSAAELGYAPAQTLLGYLYEHGEGVPKDKTEALNWYQLAIKQDYASAQFNLACMCTDEEEVVKLYQLAAKQGHSSAQNNLGYMYEHGKGVKEDKTKAIKCYRLAAKQGNGDAQYNLGDMYKYGKGTAQNEKKAQKWYLMAAKKGNAFAQFELGQMCEQGSVLPKDMVEALKWYRLAAEQFYQRACEQLAKNTESSAKYHLAMLENKEDAVVTFLLEKASLSIELLFDIERSGKNEVLFETVLSIVQKLKEKNAKVTIYEAAINNVRVQKVLVAHQKKINHNKFYNEAALATLYKTLKDIDFSKVTSEHIQRFLTLLTDNWYASTNNTMSNTSAITNITANYLTQLIYHLKIQEKPNLDSHTIRQCLVILTKNHFGPQYEIAFITPDLNMLIAVLAFIQMDISVEKINQCFEKDMIRKIVPSHTARKKENSRAEINWSTDLAKMVINKLTEYLKNCPDKIAQFPYLETIYHCLNNTPPDENNVQNILEQLQNISAKYSFPSNTWFIKKDEQLKQIHYFLKRGDLEGLNQLLNDSLIHTCTESPSRDR